MNTTPPRDVTAPPAVGVPIVLGIIAGTVNRNGASGVEFPIGRN